MVITHRRVDDLDESDLFTWQVQLKREGTLPPEIQQRLLEVLEYVLDEGKMT